MHSDGARLRGRLWEGTEGESQRERERETERERAREREGLGAEHVDGV